MFQLFAEWTQEEQLGLVTYNMFLLVQRPFYSSISYPVDSGDLKDRGNTVVKVLEYLLKFELEILPLLHTWA